MKSLLSALVLTAAAILPVSAAGIHDFNTENSRPAPATASARGKCLTTRDKSFVCYLKVSDRHYSLAIHDVDHPGYATSVFIDCQTGKWNSWGILNKAVLDQYLDGFCTRV
jgi:hypothetical protein